MIGQSLFLRRMKYRWPFFLNSYRVRSERAVYGAELGYPIKRPMNRFHRTRRSA